MSDLDDKHTFVFEAGKLLQAFCNDFVTRVFAVHADNSPAEHRGTALMCTIDGRRAFVTANHVLTQIAADPRFRTFGISAMREGAQCTIRQFDDLDIAVIIPDGTPDVRETKGFWPAERSDANIGALKDDYLMVHGYPCRLSRFFAMIDGYNSETYTHCTSIRPRESEFSTEELAAIRMHFPNYLPVPDKLLRPGQFAMNYAEDSGPLRTSDGQDVSEAIRKDYAPLYQDGVALPGQKTWGAYGLSGSPVWRFGARECDWQFPAWSVDCAHLVGIVTDWNEGHQILIATPIAHVFERL